MKMSFNTLLCVAGAVLVNLAGSFCQLDVCGQAPLNTRMVGGADAAAGSWPWKADIFSLTTKAVFCGGSLINKDWVLSAAHCVRSTFLSDMVIYLGRLNKQGPNPHEIKRTIIDYIIHPQYDPASQDNNIVLIKLSSSVDFTDYIKPVCLAAAASVFDLGLPCWVTGCGLTTDSLLTITIPDKLQEVQLSILSNHDCSITHNNIKDNVLCAGQLTDGVTALCAFDHGEALVCKQDSRWIQSGIVRHIIHYGSNSECQNPTAFTRVSRYQDWINTHVTSNQPGFITFLSSNTPDPIPDIPDNPDIPDIREIPDICEIPDVPDIPDIREIREIREIPDIPDVPDIPDIPYIPEIPEIPEIPDNPEIPDIAEIPDIPDIPDVPEIPEIPEIPDNPDNPDNPEIPDIAEIPDIPDVPDVPDIPEIPDFPDNPDFPDIFSGSSANLYLFPLSLTFSIISLIFCLFL